MANNILIILEGVKPEEHIINNIRKNFFNGTEDVVFSLIFDADIHQLWEKIKEQSYIDFVNVIDVIEKKTITKACSSSVAKKNQEVLDSIDNNNISQIYLFFDYDKNSNLYDQEEFIKMLKHFDDEYEKGKLFVSYPMSEAIRDLCNTKDAYRDRVVHINTIGNDYKKNVNPQSLFCDVRKIDAKGWTHIIAENNKKAHHIIHEEYTIPDHRIGQNEIFDGQLERFVPHNNIAVLSAFPMFLIDYFGENLQSKLTS